MAIFISAYIFIGTILAIRHLSAGRVGEIGKFGTLIAYTLLWPIFIVIK